MKRCTTCKTEKPLSEFYADKRRADGRKSECKACHCKTTVRSRDPERKRETNRRWMKGYQQRPEVIERERIRSKERQDDPRVKARLPLNAAVRSGAIVWPDRCSRCGAIGPVNGHHHDCLNPLDVEWICSRCHGIEHRKHTKRVEASHA